MNQRLRFPRVSIVAPHGAAVSRTHSDTRVRSAITASIGGAMLLYVAGLASLLVLATAGVVAVWSIAPAGAIALLSALGVALIRLTFDAEDEL